MTSGTPAIIHAILPNGSEIIAKLIDAQSDVITLADIRAIHYIPDHTTQQYRVELHPISPVNPDSAFEFYLSGGIAVSADRGDNLPQQLVQSYLAEVSSIELVASPGLDI